MENQFSIPSLLHFYLRLKNRKEFNLHSFLNEPERCFLKDKDSTLSNNNLFHSLNHDAYLESLFESTMIKTRCEN